MELNGRGYLVWSQRGPGWLLETHVTRFPWGRVQAMEETVVVTPQKKHPILSTRSWHSLWPSGRKGEVLTAQQIVSSQETHQEGAQRYKQVFFTFWSKYSNMNKWQAWDSWMWKNAQIFSSTNERFLWTQIKILDFDMNSLFLHKVLPKFSDKGIFIKDLMIMLKNHKAPNKDNLFGFHRWYWNVTGWHFSVYTFQRD